VAAQTCCRYWRNINQTVFDKRQNTQRAIDVSQQGRLHAGTLQEHKWVSTHARMARMRGPTRDIAMLPQDHPRHHHHSKHSVSIAILELF
jgi:hypothetical protein